MIGGEGGAFLIFWLGIVALGEMTSLTKAYATHFNF
ncbi:hypothetical protein AG1IA_03324 [Rhizoctonia solani AG-1 IA]|uniref:Uncharacterized protein n=1 Tax=Thanatephorus cucumeris (strain AG1-IA) TaxID=983506 RepID=L8X0T1_THACA|nr:hypothetical protein AG1IA_03324 [Rhizoctonia solani AG-1 IA]